MCRVTSTTDALDRLPPLAVDARRLGAMLGLSIRTIRTMDVAGKLPTPVKLSGRCVRWVLDGPTGVKAWLAAGAPERRIWDTVAKGRDHER